MSGQLVHRWFTVWFKEGLGCTNTVLLCRSTIDHFTHCGSNVYVATLDIKKAFDRVNHYKLFVSLLRAGVPLCIVPYLLTGIVNCLSLWSGMDVYLIGSLCTVECTCIWLFFILNIRNHDLKYYVNCSFKESVVSCTLMMLFYYLIPWLCYKIYFVLYILLSMICCMNLMLISQTKCW